MLVKKGISYLRDKSIRLGEKLRYPNDIFNFGNEDERYLRSYHGGLGDNLSFSTLPEEFLKQKGIKTYLLKSAKTKNHEIIDLLWNCNPYIKGRKEGPWNAGDHKKIKYKNYFNNMILNWEYLSGLNPTNKYPKIYYKPKKIEGLEDKIAVDLNSITVKYDQKKLRDIIIGVKNNFKNKDFLWICFSKSFQNFEINQNKDLYSQNLQIKNIFHYCDVLFSLYGYLSFCSGGSHLSSAIKGSSNKLNSMCLIDNEVYEYQKKRGIYLFDNIQYLKVKNSLTEWNI